jgi:calcyclin binding protein
MSEIEEVRKLITVATFPGVVNVLKHHERLLQAQIDEATTQKEEKEEEHEEKEELSPVVEDVPVPQKQQQRAPPVAALKQDITVAAPIASAGRVVYTPITDFAWDQSGYDSPVVTVYIDLDNVGSVKDSVTCQFTKSSFDLQVLGLDQRNYRLIKDNLDKDIIPDKSKIIVKKNKIVVKLHKVKGQYSYENW